MRYMGGKTRQGKHIEEQLLKYRGDCVKYIEPFMGGGAVFARMAPHFPGAAYGSDVHPDLMLMWGALQEGWEPPTGVSREDWYRIKDEEPSALRGFVGFGCSFGGRWFGGYAASRGDDYCGQSRRSALRQAAAMRGARFSTAPYTDLEPGPGALVYCDPPYAGTTPYSGTEKFDTAEFWATVRRWADNGATVLVSEYTAPEWAEEVWSRAATVSLRRDSNEGKAVERLFLVCPLSDPAPTVDTMDDTVEQNTETAFTTSLRTAVGTVEVYDWQVLASAAAQRHVAAMYSEPTPEAVTDAMPFADPTPTGPARTVAADDGFDDPTPARPPEPEFNVSGQPKARYEWRGSVNMGYTVVWPGETELRRYKSSGNPIGITRATTFNKAASDSKAINDWGKRNVVIGASLRPDVLRRAHGLTHEEDRAALAGIVAELETAAGAKVSADEGTYLHSFTEQLDAGLLTVADAPAAYRDDLQRYVDALKAAGLEPVPGLIERTTMVTEYGGVVGTFDRIFYHRPSGTYVVGDLKTGKTMRYAMNETETQLWVYAHGVNQNGIYDWNTDTWRPVAHDAGVPNTMPPLITVREDVAVIIHMPVQGPERGEVKLVHADLEAGRRHADLCHAIRSRPKSKVRAWVPPEPAHAPTSMPAPLHAGGDVIDAEVVFDSDDVRDVIEYEQRLADDAQHRVVGTAPVAARYIPAEVLERAAGMLPSGRPWEALARGVRTQQGAAALWSQAQAAGLSDAELDRLTEIAREAIRTHDSVSGVDTPF